MVACALIERSEALAGTVRSPAKALSTEVKPMYPPKIIDAKRAVSMRGEYIHVTRADDARVERAMVRLVVLHLRAGYGAVLTTCHAEAAGAHDKYKAETSK